MYDSVKLHRFILKSEADAIHQSLDPMQPLKKGSYRKELNNLRITVTPSMLFIEGSLAQYYLGTNLSTLDIDSTRLAIESISERLNVDVSDAKVTKLEFGTNLIMDQPVELYLAKLGIMPRYDRIECARGTMSYRTDGEKPLMEVKLYDKRKQAKRYKLLIPPEMMDFPNILRYELRFRRISRYLKTKEIRAYQLWDQGFWARLLDIWYNTYQSIEKRRTLIDWSAMKGIKATGLRNAFIIHLINKVGVGEVVRFMSQVTQNGVADKTNCSRFKDYLKQCQTDVKVSCDDPDVVELDGKIEEIYRHNK